MYRLGIYGAMCVAFVGSFYYDVNHMPILLGTSWFSKLVFLTMLNFVREAP
jgi:hypothetical protein